MRDSTAASLTSNSQPSSHLSVAHDGGSAAADGPSHLRGCIRRVEELTPAEREQMYLLLTDHFVGVTRLRFEHDLAEKEWVYTGTEPSSGVIRGFSTLMRLDSTVDDEPVVAFFSGDTIISREHRRRPVLARVMGRHLFELAEAAGDVRAFWFLLSSGYKTYRFLPVFFREFFPRFDGPMPQRVARLMHALARQKFGPEFDRSRGIVRFGEPTPLRPGVADIDDRVLKDPHVAFFADANPGHVAGDELVCITELTTSNLTPAGHRMLGRSIG